MTYLSGTFKVPKDRSELHPYLLNLVVVTASVCTAVTLFIDGVVQYKPGDDLTAECHLFPVNVHLPLAGPIRYAITGDTPDEIHIEFSPKPTQQIATRREILGARGVMLNLITPIFVDFYEHSVLWVCHKFGENSLDWPAIWNFGRVIRNSISHGGTIHITKSTLLPVTWHHLSYSPTDHGKEIIGVDFQYADVLVLMFEMSDELDRLGYPAI